MWYLSKDDSLPAMSDSKQQGQMQVDAQNQQAAASNTDQQKAQIGVLEEDDEFEEFPVQGQPLDARCLLGSRASLVSRANSDT